MITIDLGIGFSIGAVVGFIFRTVIGDKLARSRNKANVRDSETFKAGAIFHAAFSPTLAQLELKRKHVGTHEAPNIDGHLEAALPIQIEAIKAYSFFVPKQKKEAYQKAWDAYYKAAQGGTWVAGFPGMPSAKDPIGFIEAKIQGILNFAKE